MADRFSGARGGLGGTSGRRVADVFQASAMLTGHLQENRNEKIET
jgi:hypothetical protein